jgi:hypothetical protein
VKPHAFRHSITSAVLDAADGNLLIARDAGGWASAAMVDEVYGHVDVHDSIFDAALRAVWGETKRLRPLCCRSTPTARIARAGTDWRF